MVTQAAALHNDSNITNQCFQWGSELRNSVWYWLHRREIIVRGQSYFSRLPKCWPPIPLSARRVWTPRLCCAGRGGWGVNILEDERNRIALLQWYLYGLHPGKEDLEACATSLLILFGRSPSSLKKLTGERSGNNSNRAAWVSRHQHSTVRMTRDINRN
jgi:hypothetical protein